MSSTEAPYDAPPRATEAVGGISLRTPIRRACSTTRSPPSSHPSSWKVVFTDCTRAWWTEVLPPGPPAR
jgi:hypothetical protein